MEIVAMIEWMMALVLIASPSPVNSCRTCHGGESYLDAKSVHAKLFGCTECHGGDSSILTRKAMSPAKGFKKIRNKKDIAYLCARCHSDVEKMLPYGEFIDEFRIYKTSKHGVLLFRKNDQKVAVCTDCHNVHDIKGADDPSSSVYPFNVPNTCGKCHSDAEYMKEYKIPTDQFEGYIQSEHGILRMQKKDLRAPGCPECHGVHGARPPAVKEIHEVCGRCHKAQDEYFKQSPHANFSEALKGCEGCHGNHKIVKPDHNILVSEVAGEGKGCLGCHSPESKEEKLGKELRDMLVKAEQVVGLALNNIERARSKGFEVDEEMVKLKEARGFVVEALTVIHSLNRELVWEYTQDAVVAAEDINDLVKAKLIEWRDRRVMFVFNIFVFAVSAVLLFIRRRRRIREEV